MINKTMRGKCIYFSICNSIQHVCYLNRRRAIALRALNERWKSLNADTSKNQIPKSFPHSSSQKHLSHPSSNSTNQAHGFASPSNIQHGHSHERVVIPKFNIDEIMRPIPLPPPPSLNPSPRDAETLSP